MVEEPGVKEEIVLKASEARNRRQLGPISLRSEPLSIRRVLEVLNEGGLDASFQRDHIEVENRKVVIRSDNDTLIVEGTIGGPFQEVQRMLSEQFVRV